MRSKRVWMCAAMVGVALWAPEMCNAQQAGVEPEWDIRTTLTALSTQAARLKPILDQVTPAEWISKGAPQAYIAQLKSSQNEMQYLIGSAQKLANQPEKLTVALETFFRIEALDRFLDSLGEGVRKYQNPALADLLKSVENENSNNHEKLRQYIVDLAATQEQELQVMSHEAQRCRSALSHRTTPAASSGSATKGTEKK